MQLNPGENIIALTTTGSEGPNFDSMEVTAMNPGSPVSASSHGTVHITADNGYILYVNGERIGAGGAALAMAAGSSSKVRKTPSWPRSWANFSLF